MGSGSATVVGVEDDVGGVPTGSGDVELWLVVVVGLVGIVLAVLASTLAFDSFVGSPQLVTRPKVIHRDARALFMAAEHKRRRTRGAPAAMHFLTRDPRRHSFLDAPRRVLRWDRRSSRA